MAQHKGYNPHAAQQQPVMLIEEKNTLLRSNTYKTISHCKSLFDPMQRGVTQAQGRFPECAGRFSQSGISF
jgi:hypothetical protein